MVYQKIHGHVIRFSLNAFSLHAAIHRNANPAYNESHLFYPIYYAPGIALTSFVKHLNAVNFAKWYRPVGFEENFVVFPECRLKFPHKCHNYEL
jgi:hypothetical protein